MKTLLCLLLLAGPVFAQDVPAFLCTGTTCGEVSACPALAVGRIVTVFYETNDGLHRHVEGVLKESPDPDRLLLIVKTALYMFGQIYVLDLPASVPIKNVNFILIKGDLQ